MRRKKTQSIRKRNTRSAKKDDLLQKAALQAAEGVFGSLIDISLWTVAYMSNLALPQSRFGASYRAAQEADRFLWDVNYEALKRTLKNARSRGLIVQPGRGNRAHPAITAEGKKRLRSIVPHYDKKRVWDKRVYLVTYDISEKRRKDRNLLREYLKKIGCGKLQDSVWITPYNPRDTLHEFIAERQLDAAVIVSDIGENGSIGTEDLKDLITRVYQLEEINEEYKGLLQEAGKRRDIDSMLLLRYFSILSSDPQLPFDLLPQWWIGDKVWKKFKPKLKRILD